MTAHPMRARTTRLTGRRSEHGMLDRLVGAVRAGQGRALLLAALHGNQAEATLLIEATLAAAEAAGQGGAAAYPHWATANLHNGLGRHADALAAAARSTCMMGHVSSQRKRRSLTADPGR